MTKRTIALQLAKIAGYHNDTASFTRLIIESRVNRSLMNQQFKIGSQQKTAGVKFDCRDCKTAAVQLTPTPQNL